MIKMLPLSVAVLIFTLAPALCSDSDGATSVIPRIFGIGGGETDPEVHMGAADIIRRWGYPVEEYNVTTPDGYILTLFRIPKGKNSSQTDPQKAPAIFFMHGLEADCIMWISNLPDQNAPMIMADQGFDVWLGNFRGNRYGKAHVNMTSKEHKFWEFSWDQLAQYDLPTMINFILDKKKAPWLYYAGHSMGTMTAFAQFSTDQAFGKKIKKFYAMAPLTTVGHIKGLLKTVATFMRKFEWAISKFGQDEFMPPNWLMKQMAIYGCGNTITDDVCSYTVFAMAGPGSKQLNMTRMPVYMAHTPAGTATRVVLHFAQQVESNNFHKFDFGTSGNKKYYNQSTPPLYNVSAMETPVVMFWGGNDWLADPEDVAQLLPLLKNCVGKFYLPDFNHMDFLWGLRAAKEIFWPMVEDMKNDLKNSMGA